MKLTTFDRVEIGAPRPEKPASPQPIDGPLRRQAVVWKPSRGVVVAWSVLGSAYAALGMVLSATLHAATHGGSASFTIAAADLLPAAATLVALVLLFSIAHELLHGLLIRGCGSRPRYGVHLVARVLPALYTTAPGERFTRPQFVGIALAPMLVLSTIGVLLVVLAPFGGALVIPLGMHLGGCVGDIWLAALTLRQPAGTLVEDQEDGVIFLSAANRSAVSI